ncbi:MAG: carbohydrate kinase [Eubacteriales bacterium]|nr:carbohydrate kinase [Eubacteriales bacterium]
MKKDVIALGELLIDFTDNGLSQQGNRIFEANPGGAPCNVLSMLANYGKKTGFIGKIGKDQFGNILKQTIENIGIDTKGLIMDKNFNTTLAFVHTMEDGDRDFSFYRTLCADCMLNENEVSEDLIKDYKVFHFGTLSMTNETCFLATKKALDIAKENNLLISFDPNLRPPLWEDLNQAKEKINFGLNFCDILKISEEELEFLTDEKDIEKGVSIIKNKYDIKLIVVTMGKNGSYAFYNDISVFGKPFIMPNTIETTGAGDTFMASTINFVLDNGLNNLNKESLSNMLTISNAAAAIITTRKGAIKVMPTVNEINDLINNAK